MLFEMNQVVEFKGALVPKTSILGVDFGTKRVGLACCDERWSFASSLKIVDNQNVFKDIQEFSLSKNISAVVVGLPLQMNGEEGEMAALVREFANKLSASLGLNVLLWDERLSSRASENFLIKEANVSRKKRKNILDASAAAFILQGALDRIAFL